MSQEPTSNSIQPTRRKPRQFILSATYPLRALQILIAYPNYRTYVLVPIAINVLLGITLYAGLLVAGLRAIDALIATVPHWAATASQGSVDLPHWSIHLPQWMTLSQGQITPPDWFTNLLSWRPTLPEWLTAWLTVLPGWIESILIWLLRLLLTIVLLIVTGFILLQFGVLLGAPWYGKLSEELEKLQTGQLVLIEVGIAQDIWRAILYELKKLVIGFGLGIPILVLGLLPGAGTLAASIGGIAIATTLVCLDFIDAPLERRRLRFRQKLGILWRTLPASASFGLVCFGLVSLPLINLLAIPLCVAAGTLFACDYVLPDLSQQEQ